MRDVFRPLTYQQRGDPKDHQTTAEKTRTTHLALFLLDQREHLLREQVVLGARVREHVDEGVGQRLLQGFLHRPDAHLGAVAPALHVQVTQHLLELVRVRRHGDRTDFWSRRNAEAITVQFVSAVRRTRTKNESTSQQLFTCHYGATVQIICVCIDDRCLGTENEKLKENNTFIR